MELEPNAGGMEVGTDLPLVQAPDLGAQMRALSARHPELFADEFEAFVRAVFTRIQVAWSTLRYEDARPFETDALYQQHRAWIERYRKAGLRNRCEDLRIGSVLIARVGVDAWVEFVTVRIFASMRDWTEDSSGRLVGGNATTPRQFSEYWTFVRTAGKPARPRSNLDTCPSRGAPLDRVGASGVCGHCDAKVTTGDFDWVLAAIDQDEVYRG